MSRLARFAWRERRLPLKEIFAAPQSWASARGRLLQAGFELREPKPSGEPRLRGEHSIECAGGELVYRQRYKVLPP